MKCFPFFASVFLLGVAGVGSAQSGYSQVSAASGSVAATGGAGPWTGLAGSAARATIGYADNGHVVTPPNAFKFATSSTGTVTGKTLSPYSNETPTGFVSIGGASRVDSGQASTDYFTVDWTSELYAQNAGSSPANSGTFDPFDVRYGDVSGLVSGSGTVDLYYQSGLRKNGYGGNTFLIAQPGAIARYGYSLYVTDPAGNRTSLLDIDFASDRGLEVGFGGASGFELTLLGANAEDPSVSPDARIEAGTAVSSQSGAEALLAPYFQADGRLTRDLLFGVRHEIAVLPGGSPDDVILAWHTDTRNGVDAVPEPASLTALGLGALGLWRRRARKI